MRWRACRLVGLKMLRTWLIPPDTIAAVASCQSGGGISLPSSRITSMRDAWSPWSSFRGREADQPFGGERHTIARRPSTVRCRSRSGETPAPSSSPPMIACVPSLSWSHDGPMMTTLAFSLPVSEREPRGDQRGDVRFPGTVARRHQHAGAVLRNLSRDVALQAPDRPLLLLKPAERVGERCVLVPDGTAH